MTRQLVVAAGEPEIVSSAIAGEPLIPGAVTVAEIPAIVERVAAALDFLRDRATAHGPLGVATVRVLRDPHRTITGVELSLPDDDLPPASTSADVHALASFVRELATPLPVGPELPTIVVAAESTPDRYPHCAAFAADVSGAAYRSLGAAGPALIGGPARPRRRGLLIAGVIVAVILLVVGGTVAGLTLFGSDSDGSAQQSTAELPRQEYLVANPDGVDVGSWTAVSMAPAPEWDVPSVCAISDGKVYCRSPWIPLAGPSSSDGGTLRFVEIEGVHDVTDVSGGYPACIVTDAKAACWGGPDSVNGAGAGKGKPGIVAGLSAATRVGGGSRLACAVVNGQVACWGDESYPEAYEDMPTVPPTLMPGLSGVTAIAIGDRHGCAIAAQRLMCWGNDDFGQLGVGYNGKTYSAGALPAVGLGTVSAVAVANDHTCAVSAGKAYCWGRRGDGALGFPGASTQVTKPRPVEGLRGTVTAIATADDHTCAVVDGQAWCWGVNDKGQLGTGNITNSEAPVPVPRLTQVTSISATKGATCAINAGNLYCWGKTS